MPSITTGKVSRHGEGTPRQVRFRITWPDDSVLGPDSEEERDSDLFELEMQDAKDPDSEWIYLGSYPTKGKAQEAADAEVGYELRLSGWQEDEDSSEAE